MALWDVWEVQPKVKFDCYQVCKNRHMLNGVSSYRHSE